MMQNFDSIYLNEVLGIKNYLCPKNIHSLRTLHGRWPAKSLAVAQAPLSQQEKDLLKKIMHSAGLFDFSCLEIKDSKYFKNFLEQLNSKSITQNVIVFEGGSTSKHSHYLQTYSLKELLNSQEKKKELWLELKSLKA